MTASMKTSIDSLKKDTHKKYNQFEMANLYTDKIDRLSKYILFWKFFLNLICTVQKKKNSILNINHVSLEFSH